MSHSIVWRLIAKDLYLYRWIIVGATAGAAASFLIAPTGSFGLRAILYITSLVALGIFVVMYGVLKERQDKSLLFVLSLPVSPLQYGVAKLAAASIAFVAPWLLALAVSVALLTSSESNAGQLPFAVALMGLFFCNFCILLAVVMITMSEIWAVAGILVTNMSISLYIPFVMGLPGIAEHREGPVAVWTSTAVTIVALELAIGVLAIGLALFVHSRKTNFI